MRVVCSVDHEVSRLIAFGETASDQASPAGRPANDASDQAGQQAGYLSQDATTSGQSGPDSMFTPAATRTSRHCR